MPFICSMFVYSSEILFFTIQFFITNEKKNLVNTAFCPCLVVELPKGQIK